MLGHPTVRRDVRQEFGVLVLDLRLADEVKIQLNVLIGFDDANL